MCLRNDVSTTAQYAVETADSSDTASVGSAGEHSSQHEVRGRYPPTASDHGHRNVCRPLAVLEAENFFFVLFPFRRHSLHHILTYAPDILKRSHAKPMFIVYQVSLSLLVTAAHVSQLLRTLEYLHQCGLVHGNLRASNVMVDKRLWVEVTNLTFHIPYQVLCTII